MNKTVQNIMIVLVAAVLILGIAYAAISNITLNISGTITATPNSNNFVVKFTGTPTTSGSGTITATLTDNLNATFNVTGLTAKDQTAQAVYTITNASPDLSAKLTKTTCTISNTDYFSVACTLNKTTVTGNSGTATLTVKVTMLKTPITEDVSGDVTVKITAAPVNP